MAVFQVATRRYKASRGVPALSFSLFFVRATGYNRVICNGTTSSTFRGTKTGGEKKCRSHVVRGTARSRRSALERQLQVIIERD